MNVWTNLKCRLGLGQVLYFCWRIYYFSRSSSPTLIYFNTSYSCTSYSNTLLFLSDGTSSLLSLIVMFQRFKFFPSTTSCNLLLQIFSPSTLYHLITFNRLQPITPMSSFATQLIFNSTFNLYRRFNINSYSIFN